MGLIDKLNEVLSRKTGSWVTMDGDVLFRHKRRSKFGTVKIVGQFDITTAMKITAYKLDLGTTDTICLRFESEDGNAIALCEDAAAWVPVMDALAKWDEIDREWYQNVMLPVFETSETVIYERR